MKKNIHWILMIPLALWSFLPLSTTTSSGIDLLDFSRLPILDGGRVKPMSTLAQTSLLILRHRETIPTINGNISASQWLLDLLSRPQVADSYKVFCIDDLDVIEFLGFQAGPERYFAFENLVEAWDKIESQATNAASIAPRFRSRFQRAVTTLYDQLVLYQRLKCSLEIPATLKRAEFLEKAASFRALPRAQTSGKKPSWSWINPGEAFIFAIPSAQAIPAIAFYRNLLSSSALGNETEFNQNILSYRAWLSQAMPSLVFWSDYEDLFNRISPFNKGMTLYAITFILLCLSWIIWPKELARAALYILAWAWAIHSMGIFSRMIIQGRPPVTNLYSSALFVGWVSVALGWALEKRFPMGFAAMVASLIGFITLLIAHHLAQSGDTIEMMRAVLNSNFWLATHVLAITIGYSSTFVAGSLGILYIIRGTLTSNLDKESAKALMKMTYGVVCFRLLFSFVGTILGGIWADQYWGRFWGWDPKENGALLIVLWNAIVLHARWGGYIRERGLIIMVVLGNIVTSISWFGVNMLGIGLHSYGWMDKAFFWLALFIISQLAIALLGALPRRYWKSPVLS